MSYTAGERHWALYETARNEQMHDWEYRLVRDEHGVGLTLPDHPALPAIAKLLHDEPGLADAVHDVLIHGGMADQPHIHSVIRLAAALNGTEDGDGTNG